MTLMPMRPRLAPVRWTPPPWPERARHDASSPPMPPVTVLPLPGKGPEDVLCTPDGDVLTGISDGRVLRVAPSGQVREVAQTGGRPLGLEWLPDGRLLVCDAARGLLALDLGAGSTPTSIEVLADSVDGQPFMFCNNAAVASDGTIYFTDSSRRFGVQTWRGAILEHAGDGRLLRRAPDGALDVLCDGLEFPNGVALSADESCVFVAQTGAYGIERVDVRGSSGRQPFVELPGFPDNISTGSDGLVWVAMASLRNALLDRLHQSGPHARRLVWSVPQWLQPGPDRMAWVMAFDESGDVVHDAQGAVPGFFMCTGVREQAGRVWMGSLEAPSLAWFELPR